MTRQEYAESLVRESYKKYEIKIKWKDLPWSGELIDVELNDGTMVIVDRMVEFTLCSMYSYYFIDRYCWTIPARGGPIPFKLFDFQIKALEAFQNNQFNIFRKSRQVGATIISGCFALWRANFHKAEMIKIISLSKIDAIEMKEKTIDLNYEMMPGFLKSKTKGLSRPSKMKLELINRSTVRVLSKSKQAGRGGTPSLVIIDEAAFNEWMSDIWKAMENSFDKGGYCIVISTTNGVGNWYHRTYTRAEEGTNEFNPIFIPWWRYPGRDNPWLEDIINKIDNKEITKEELAKFIKKEENKQLSYEGEPTKAPWLWKRKHNAETEKDFQQETMAEFLGSGDTVITPKTIEILDNGIVSPEWVDMLPDESHIPNLWCWKEVIADNQYMLTADTATGHGKDFSTLEVIDINTNEQVAEYKGLVATDKFGEIIKQVAIYYNYAYVAIETNHPGPAVFNEVYRSKIDPYQNVYVKAKGKAFVSWETNTKSRVLLIEAFFKDLENQKTKIYSERFIEEVKTFIWSSRDKAEAMSGYNDDLIISYAMHAHLKEFVLSSRPSTILSSKGEVTGDDVDWSEKDEIFEDMYGMSMEDYYWMQGKKLPKGYIEYKKKQEEDGDNNTTHIMI